VEAKPSSGGNATDSTDSACPYEPIYWDTMLFVYRIEDHPDYAARVNRIFSRMRERGDTLCTSVFTVGEILVGPYRKGALEVASQVRAFLRPPDVELLPFTAEAADDYARIRAAHRIPRADAIHLASAARSNVDLFLTNDRRLLALVIPGIQFIAGIDVALF
jgi:predicted nucleic acid-binding protein